MGRFFVATERERKSVETVSGRRRKRTWVAVAFLRWRVALRVSGAVLALQVSVAPPLATARLLLALALMSLPWVLALAPAALAWAPAAFALAFAASTKAPSESRGMQLYHHS